MSIEKINGLVSVGFSGTNDVKPNQEEVKEQHFVVYEGIEATNPFAQIP